LVEKKSDRYGPRLLLEIGASFGSILLRTWRSGELISRNGKNMPRSIVIPPSSLALFPSQRIFLKKLRRRKSLLEISPRR
jgi:hypothetical protein